MELEHYNLLGLDRYCTNDDIRDKYQQLSVKQHGMLNEAEAIKKRENINLALNVLGVPELRKLYDLSNGKPQDIFCPVALTEEQLTTPNQLLDLKINVLELCPVCEGDKFGKCLLCLGVNKRITIHSNALGVTHAYSKCRACFGVSRAINSDECVKLCRNGFRESTIIVTVPIKPELLHSGPERDGTVVLKKVGNASRFPILWKLGDIYLKFFRQSNPFIRRTLADPQKLRNVSSEQQNSKVNNISASNEPVGPIIPEDDNVNEKTMDVEADLLSTDSTHKEHSGDKSVDDIEDSDSGDGVESDGGQSALSTSTSSQLEEALLRDLISDRKKDPLTIHVVTTSGMKTFTLENGGVLENHDSTSTSQTAHDTGNEVINLTEDVDGQTQSESLVASKGHFFSLNHVNRNPTPMKQTGEPSNSGMRLLCGKSLESVSPRVMEDYKATRKTLYNDLNKFISEPWVPNYITTLLQQHLSTAKYVDAMTAKIKTGGTSTSLDRCPDELVCNANNDSANLPGPPISDDEESGCIIQQDCNADADTPTGANEKSSIKRKSEKAKLDKGSQPSKKVKGKSFTTSTGALDSSAGVSPSTSSMRASSSSAQLSPPTSYIGTCKSSEEPYTSPPRNEQWEELVASPDVERLALKHLWNLNFDFLWPSSSSSEEKKSE